MGRLNFYTTETNYNTSKNSFDYPTVAYVNETEEVKWMSIQDKYAREYLTIEIVEDNTTLRHSIQGSGIKSILYSLDNGKTWTQSSDRFLSISGLTAGQKVLFKGTRGTGTYSYIDDGETGTGDAYYSGFSTSARIKVFGNIMSLAYGDDFVDNTTLVAKEEFAWLFQSCHNIIDCSNLILPATTLTDSCYRSMFNGCTPLTTAPELPATTLADSCYREMFRGCTSLTTAPDLPVTTLTNYCYDSMFYGCSSLTTAPELPATTLTESCYYQMFYGCTSLTTAPVLPATTLANYCYQYMFHGCTALTTAPVLPAKTLANNCYAGMFWNCSNLNYIKAMFTTTPSSTYTSGWVSGVAATGTFWLDCTDCKRISNYI